MARDKIAKLRKDVENLEGKIAVQEQEINAANRLKRLVTASGDEFKNVVAEALRDLGLTVVEGPHPRADLLITDGTRLAAVEAKGLDGCAKESNVTQANRWVADVHSTLVSSPGERDYDPDLRRYGEQLRELGFSLEGGDALACKGIMVIGTFRRLPLDQRVDADFPEPVLRLLGRSQVCALTGLQLLGLCLLTRSNTITKDGVRDALFSANGVVKLAQDWREFISTLPNNG